MAERIPATTAERPQAQPPADRKVTIHLENVHKTYDLGEVQVPALRGVSLNICKEIQAEKYFVPPDSLLCWSAANDDTGVGFGAGNQRSDGSLRTGYLRL
jgi:hypothetical protein